jgi:hypothetical protein
MRSRPAARSPRSLESPGHQDRPRRGRVAFVLAALASIAFLVGACGSGPASSSSTATGAGTGTGAVIRPGSGSGSQSGNRSSGSYSVAFAGCMRAHGVAKFPNPDGSGSQLGPDSGINPASRAFQAALNGPCNSLAPAGWVSSGTVTRGGGS